jgi:type II secretory pathway pseudopilin PulG
MNNKKGVTLLELVAVLGLTGIVVSLIITIFAVNYNNYNTINNQRELQFQAQHIFNFMADKVKVSINIEQIRYDLESRLSDTDEQIINKICFNYDENIDKCYIFEISNNRIYYDNDKSSNKANVLLGDYIDEMYSCPIPEGTSFRNADAVKIRLKLSKGNERYEVEQIIYMRNSKRIVGIKYNLGKMNKYIDKCPINL